MRPASADLSRKISSAAFSHISFLWTSWNEAILCWFETPLYEEDVKTCTSRHTFDNFLLYKWIIWTCASLIFYCVFLLSVFPERLTKYWFSAEYQACAALHISHKLSSVIFWIWKNSSVFFFKVVLGDYHLTCDHPVLIQYLAVNRICKKMFCFKVFARYFLTFCLNFEKTFTCRFLSRSFFS